MRKYSYFYVCAVLLAGLWAAHGSFVGWSDSRSRARSIPLRKPLEAVPFRIGQWLGRSVGLGPEIVQVANADEFIRRNYRNNSDGSVALYITYYAGLYRVVPHGPGVCYPMGGWKTLEHQTVSDGTGSATHHLFVFEKELDKQVVVYWYYVNGMRLAGSSWTRLRFASDVLRGSGGSIVQVQLATDLTATKTEALAALNDFRAQLEPLLAEFLPAHESKNAFDKH
ncbi:MAG: EpsI family protein [Planctomycetes bacterium]|nr:EpsI family protein [Planctomycetota bacterium]